MRKSDLSIIKVSTKRMPLLVQYDLDEDRRYYKYPTFGLAFGLYSLMETKPKEVTLNQYIDHYARSYVLPNLKHEPLTYHTGWLSPLGRFYPCYFDEILMLASALCVLEINKPGSDEELYKNGWVLVNYNGVIARQNGINKDQLEIIRNLILAVPNTSYSKKMWVSAREYLT